MMQGSIDSRFQTRPAAWADVAEIVRLRNAGSQDTRGADVTAEHWQRRHYYDNGINLETDTQLAFDGERCVAMWSWPVKRLMSFMRCSALLIRSIAAGVWVRHSSSGSRIALGRCCHKRPKTRPYSSTAAYSTAALMVERCWNRRGMS